MVILTVEHICFVLISPPGELTSMVCFINDMIADALQQMLMR
jgi:hypothetical protein